MTDRLQSGDCGRVGRSQPVTSGGYASGRMDLNEFLTFAATGFAAQIVDVYKELAK
mgnify:CR=1 FL=1